MNNTNNTNAIPVEVVDYLEAYFETYNVLPTKVLECNAGTGAYVAFGQNLKTKIEKAGGIRELLTTFVGRGAKKKEIKKAEKTEVKAAIQKRTKKASKVEESVEETIA
jgi:hypothetical protein